MSQASGSGGPQLARLNQLLDQALALPVEERTRWLDSLGPADAGLRPVLADLLARNVSTEASGLLGTLPPLTDAAMLVTAATPRVEVGDRVGPYHLLQLLAEGGMGQVWLAEQHEPLRRKVALKVIKAGMDSKEVVARFESERQALALMDHPAIAHVFDGGTAANGRPYFVMEYVAGVPVNRYCDAQRLGTEQRLELFQQICDGVQHAHQKAIIHRDLKPSNVLVTDVGDRPQAKIIDFGIAKALGQQLTEKTLVTELGAFIGTPEYMSPEQADLGAQDVDTRTDVYSLGVILYELLTGTLPFSSKELRERGLDELRRKIREVDPPRPSTRLSTLGDGSEPRTGGGERGTLVRRLRGDLDAITMKALEKDRRRRYATPSELAADIGRHLRHEPVLARVPSTTYRVARYVRRHRIGVAVGSVLVGLLVAFAVTATLQARRIQRESAATQRVSDFLTGMFKLSDPGETRGSTITAREILDRAAGDVESSLAKEPELQARMMAVMGDAYVGLGLYGKAAPLLEQGYQLRLQNLGPDDLSTIRAASLLGGLYSRQGRRKEAEKLLSGIVDRCRRSRAADSAECLGAANVLGIVENYLGHFDRARELHRQTLDARRRVLGSDDRTTLASMMNLATTETKLGHLEEAEKLLVEATRTLERTMGPEHNVTLNAKNNLAHVYMSRRQYPQAAGIYREGIEVRTRVLGPEHPDTLTSANNLAEALQKEGKLAEAEALQRKTIDAELRVHGPDHPTTLLTRSSLADTLVKQGKLDEGETLLDAVAATQRRVLGDPHPDLATTLLSIGVIHLRRGDIDGALSYLQRAIASGLDPSDREGLATDDDWKPLRGDPRFQALAAPPGK